MNNRNADTRSALFSGATERHVDPHENQNRDQTKCLLEEQNDEQIGHLSLQINQLKQLSQSIHSEVLDQNRYLDGMGKDFDRTEGLLGGTMRKLGIMMDQGGMTIGETRVINERQISRFQLPIEMEKSMVVYQAQREDSLRDVASRYDMNVNELKALNELTSDEIAEGQLIKVYRRKRSNSLPVVPFLQDLLSHIGIYNYKDRENESTPETNDTRDEHLTASTPPKTLLIEDTEDNPSQQEELRNFRRNHRSHSEQIPMIAQDMLPILIGGSNAELLANAKYRHSLLPRLEHCLPYRFRGYNWQLLYSTARHGSSLHTLLARVAKISPTILIIKTVQGDVLGGFAPTSWETFNAYYGIGESFVFTCWPYFNVFPWSKENSMFMFSNGELIAMGGGGNFAWSLDSDLSRGTSGKSKTFSNPCLASSAEFVVSSVEVWGFIVKD
ncbi:hypothetical protein ABG067_001768 [Albugo candida]